MRHAWIIDTHGKPLEAVNKLFGDLWQTLQLSHMLLPLKKPGGSQWTTEEISNKAQLKRSNPFTPLMTENIAQKIPEFQKAHPGEKLAALLRPCEISALKKIDEHLGVERENLVILSADCLGTYPADEFFWRAERKGSADTLADENVKFSRSGGILQYRYRSACQLCKNPIATEADININIAGLPVRNHIMLSTYNGMSKQIEMADITDGIASQEILALHDEVSQKMIYRNDQTRERLSTALVENTDLDIDKLFRQLNECGDCQTCMHVCPICNLFGYSREEDGILSKEVLADWMAECVGCGMCEQSCEKHKPLAVIFSVIHDQLEGMSH